MDVFKVGGRVLGKNVAQSHEFQHVQRHRRAPVGSPYEIAELTEQILRASGAEGPVLPFLTHRYASRLHHFGAVVPRYRWADSVVSVIAVTASIATTSVAAGWGETDGGLRAILILGILGSVAGVVNWLWRPGLRASSGTQAQNALLDEGWSYVMRRGRYERAENPEDALNMFIDEVSSALRIAAEVEEELPKGPAPGQAVQQP